jgi:hypothetical protein
MMTELITARLREGKIDAGIPLPCRNRGADMCFEEEMISCVLKNAIYEKPIFASGY